jgi:MFS family permease
VKKDELTILLAEYAQLRESERNIRTSLYGINGFTIATFSGLLVGITEYKVQALVLIGPMIIFLAGFLWSTESLRLIRIIEHLREIERAMRHILVKKSRGMLSGFEDRVQTGKGLTYFMRRNSTLLASALMYSVFYSVFLYLLIVSPYDQDLKTILVIGYLSFCAVFWLVDLWAHREYIRDSLSPKRDKPPSQKS